MRTARAGGAAGGVAAISRALAAALFDFRTDAERTMDTRRFSQEQDPLDPDDPRLSRFDVVREGLRRDGVEIVQYGEQAPPGSAIERRMARVVSLFFLVTGLSAAVFLAVYIWWPWQYELGSNASKLYTPLLGLSLGVALLGVGFGILTWGKKLLPREMAIQDRHDGASKRGRSEDHR